MATTVSLSLESLDIQTLTAPRTYYRSQLFNDAQGINGLTAAASPLFLLVEFFLQEKQNFNQTERLFQNFLHEMNAFENCAKRRYYHSDIIMAARYILCAYIDDSLSAKYSLWQSHSLLKYFYQEQPGEDQLFLMLEKLMQDVEMYIDLLELIYLCLRFGYQGKYRHEKDPKDLLEKISARLFEEIKLERGELKKPLQYEDNEKQRAHIVKFALPAGLLLSFTAALLLTLYSSFSYMLGTKAQLLYQQMNNIFV